MKRPADIPLKQWRKIEELQEEIACEREYERERKRERQAWDRWLRGKTRRLAVLERKVSKVVAARNAVLAEHSPPFAELEIAKRRLRLPRTPIRGKRRRKK